MWDSKRALFQCACQAQDLYYYSVGILKSAISYCVIQADITVGHDIVEAVTDEVNITNIVAVYYLMSEKRSTFMLKQHVQSWDNTLMVKDTKIRLRYMRNGKTRVAHIDLDNDIELLTQTQLESIDLEDLPHVTECDL